jgi:hypothetical protein
MEDFFTEDDTKECAVKTARGTCLSELTTPAEAAVAVGCVRIGP